MSATNSEVDSENLNLNSNFDLGNFMDEAEKSDDDMYALDLNVQNSNHDDEFDLEKIKQDALISSNEDIDSDRISNFPEIDLILSRPRNLSEPISEVLNSDPEIEMALKTRSTEKTPNYDIESPVFEPMSPVNVQKSQLKSSNVLEILSDEIEQYSEGAQTNSKYFQSAGSPKKAAILEDDSTEEINSDEDVFSVKSVVLDKEALVLDKEDSSMPSPFLSTLTPPNSPVLVKYPIKSETPIEINDDFYDQIYYDDNLGVYHQEEVYLEEQQNECCDDYQQIKNNLSEIAVEDRDNLGESSGSGVVTDHNYFNREQNVREHETNFYGEENYNEPTNSLSKLLENFAKNIEIQTFSEVFKKHKIIEDKLNKFIEKIKMLQLSKNSKKVSYNVKNMNFNNQNDSNNMEVSETISSSDDIIMNQFDRDVIEALKKTEENLEIDFTCNNIKNEKDLKQNESKIIDKLESVADINQNEIKKNLKNSLSVQSVEEHEIYEEVVEKKKDKSNQELNEIGALTKYESLRILGKTIIEFFNNPTTDSSIKDFFEECRKEFFNLFINSSQTDTSTQTDYSGKIYSARRLKSINEKEKLKLLNDTSESSSIISSSEYESDEDSTAKDMDLNNEDQDTILNGIDFSKYLDSSNDEDNFPNDFSEHLDIILEEEDSNKDIVEKNYNDSEENENNQNEMENKKENESAIVNSQKSTLIDEKKVDNEKKGKEELLDSDKEIERLLDFKNLSNDRVILNSRGGNRLKKVSTKKIAVADISEILAEQENKDSSDGSNSEEEDCIATENSYLIRQNENLKKELLESSSNSGHSDNDSSELSPYEIDEEDDDDEQEEYDENKPTLVEKFLKSYIDDDESEKENEVMNFNKQFSSVKKSVTNSCDDNESEKGSKKAEKDSENKEYELDEDSDRTDIVNSDCEILDKAFASLKQKNKKRKSLDTLLVEDERRRKNLKISEEIFSLSSDTEDSDIEEKITKKTEPHRIIRPIMKNEQLTSETKKAQKEEQGRLNRLKKKENILKKAYKEHNRDPSDIKELVLDYNSIKKEFITVNNGLVRHLKQHQIDGVKFMYDCCYGSVNFLEEFPGSGCILAHCMGLGKTLQLITLLHTLITYKELKTNKILILCPKSTVMNWAEEIERWLDPLGVKSLKVFTFQDVSDIIDKIKILQQWHVSGSKAAQNSGCLLLGYEAFRTLVSYPNKKNRSVRGDIEEIKSIIKKTLLDPGADLVVCDEGHIIKNRRAAISQAVQEIKTPRRIVLTGTPIQNNLKEYYSMVNFIKPSYLGTEKEFANLYANPIKNGQHKDSSKRDIQVMKQRSFVLHSKLSSFVQRKEAALLKTFLPQKFEYVLFIPMTNVQIKLYEIFLEAVGKREDSDKKGRNLLTDYTCLRKIWTHPKVLENAYNNAMALKNKKEKKLSNVELGSDEDQPDDIYDSQTGLMSVTSDWWRQHLSDQDLKCILPSSKLQTMFEILRMCTENREKCLIFSAFVAVLNVVEFFMNIINNKNAATANEFGIERFNGPWINGKDYYRLDGKTPKTLRHEMVKSFNDPKNERARVFLISAKAGGQGINLIGANRVIILDTSWNPSNDQQNIFRIFRLGQKRNCYIYRLISFGTMEEKVYSRSVTKQAMSFRVVDEHQIDRHYSMAELAELYTLTKPDYTNRPIPNLPQDNILAHLLRNFPQYVFKYHEHDSLLENKIEQELSEQEKQDAWAAYESEANAAANSGLPILPGFDMFGIPGGPIQNFGNFSRTTANDIFNQSRAGPSTASPFFPGYNFSNKAYLDNMFSYFSNSAHGNIDLTKSPVYGDTLGSNFLLPNQRQPGNITPTHPTHSPSPVSSPPNYPSWDSLLIPSSHANTFNPKLPTYNALYSGANNLLGNQLNRFSTLDNFKRFFENYVNPTPTGLYSTTHLNPQNEINKTKQPILNDMAGRRSSSPVSTSKTDINSIPTSSTPLRKQNPQGNFTGNLPTTNSGSMTNSILNAQNRLISQSSNLNGLITAKKGALVTTTPSTQKDTRTQQQHNSVPNQINKQLNANSTNSNPFSTPTSKHSSINISNRLSNKPSDLRKTDSVRNTTLSLLKGDNYQPQNRTSPKTVLNDIKDKNSAIIAQKQLSSLTKQQASAQKSHLEKVLASQSMLPSTLSPSTTKGRITSLTNRSPASTNTVPTPTNRIPTPTNRIPTPTNQIPTPTNKNQAPPSNALQSKSKNSTSKEPINLVKNGNRNPKSTSLSNEKINSPIFVNTNLITKQTASADVSNNKNQVNLNKLIQSKGQKTQNIPQTQIKQKLLSDPLSIELEDKLTNAGISISKKNTSSSTDTSNLSQIKSSKPLNSPSLSQELNIQRKRSATQESSNKNNELNLQKRPSESLTKKPKLTPKELAEELSSSLKRIQSSKGLTILQNNTGKGPPPNLEEVFEVD